MGADLGQGTFEPKIVKKHQTRWTGFDDKILLMYARGMRTREIQRHLEEIYGVEVSPALASNAAEAVHDKVRAWQNRPLEPIVPIVFLDVLYVRMRDNGHVQNRAVYAAIGLKLEGNKEVLGLWTSVNEGAKSWLQVLTEIRNRGVSDIFLACVDGLKGFPEAIESVYPQTQVQLCIVHLVRQGLNYVSWKQRKTGTAGFRPICTAPTAEETARQLEEFAAQWDGSHSTISQVWKRNWHHITPFFAFPREIRKVVGTANAVESLHMALRKIIKTRGAFPNEESALRLLYLALRNSAKNWTSVQGWREALNHFQILWPERMPALEPQ